MPIQATPSAALSKADGTTLDGGHAGKGDILVAEADESDGSFAKYHPTIAIITNCEADHLDHYGDEATTVPRSLPTPAGPPVT